MQVVRGLRSCLRSKESFLEPKYSNITQTFQHPLIKEYAVNHIRGVTVYLVSIS